MAKQKKYMGQICDSPHVRVERAAFVDVVELDGAVALKETWKPEHGQIVAKVELKKLEWHHREHVEQELLRAHVVDGELARVVDEQALFEVAGAKLNEYVNKINAVGDGVDHFPVGGELHLQLFERLARDYKPGVVKDANVENYEPSKHAVIIRTQHKVIELEHEAVQVCLVEGALVGRGRQRRRGRG